MSDEGVMEIVCINPPFLSFAVLATFTSAVPIYTLTTIFIPKLTMTEVARQPSVPDGASSSTLRRYVHVPETKHERMSLAVHRMIWC